VVLLVMGRILPRARGAATARWLTRPLHVLLGPDNRKITDKRIREALSWAYPYKNATLAGGDSPGATAVTATNLMPPGIPGRTAYNVTGRGPFENDPAKATQLLR
jgi:peptide/nickel transport system substrate-binding protein